MSGILLFLAFWVAAVRFGPHTPLGEACAESLKRTAEWVASLTARRVLVLALVLVVIVSFGMALPSELPMLLSIDLGLIMDVALSVAVATSVLRLRGVRATLRQLAHLVAKPVRRLGSHGRRRGRKRSSPRPPSSEPDGPWGWGWAVA